jgi:hypothetical protein
MMCEAITSDIESAEGSGEIALTDIRRVEAGEIECIEADGNAWVIHITPDKVWFEGLYGQGEGGEVSFVQYKLAVQTYVRFLAGPEYKPIEVEPAGVAGYIRRRDRGTDPRRDLRRPPGTSVLHDAERTTEAFV